MDLGRSRGGETGDPVYPDFLNPYRWLAKALGGQLDRIKETEEALEKAITIVRASFEMNVRSRVP